MFSLSVFTYSTWLHVVMPLLDTMLFLHNAFMPQQTDAVHILSSTLYVALCKKNSLLSTHFWIVSSRRSVWPSVCHLPTSHLCLLLHDSRPANGTTSGYLQERCALEKYNVKIRNFVCINKRIIGNPCHDDAIWQNSRQGEAFSAFLFQTCARLVAKCVHCPV